MIKTNGTLEQKGTKKLRWWQRVRWPYLDFWYGLKEIIGPARWARAERAARQAAQFFWRMVPLRHEQSRRMYDWRSSPRWGRERWRSIT